MNLEHPNRQGPNAPDLFREGQIISNYLVDESAPQNVLERYVQANGAVFSEPNDHGDDPVVFFIRRHPWALPFLDAITGILRPQTMLRKKILLMVSLLETSPKYTDYFISERVPVFRFWVKMAQYGMSSLFKIMIGLCIYPFAVKMK